MTDNVVTSEKVNPKPATKKAAPKKTPNKKIDSIKNRTNDGFSIVVFESGSSYNSNGLRFTQENRIQEVPEAEAERLLGLDNFRLPTQEEVDNYFASTED